MATDTDTITADAYFAMIPEAVLYDERLSPTDVRVYGCLRRHADKASGRCHPSHATIAEKIHTSARTVRRSIEVLVETGWVETTRRKNDEGAWTSNAYRVVSIQGHRTPMSHASDTSDLGDRTPVADKPESVNQRNTLTLLSEEREPEVEAPAAQSLDDDFEDWYSGYPVKKSKGAAKRAYRGARKKVDAATLLTARDAFVRLMDAQRVDKQYIKHPSTWLNGECWEDEAPPARNPFEGPEVRFG